MLLRRLRVPSERRERNSYPGGNEALANRLAAGYGWTGQQASCLDWLWTRESGFDNLIRNPAGAFGISQALGHGQPGTAAYGVHFTYSEGVGPAVGAVNEYGPGYGLTTGEAEEANAGSAVQQIRWGLGYVRADYGSPCAAWSHETANSWY